jgi:hypothetical protein
MSILTSFHRHVLREDVLLIRTAYDFFLLNVHNPSGAENTCTKKLQTDIYEQNFEQFKKGGK